MPSIVLNYGHVEFWSDYDPANGRWGNQKLTFDGVNKLIYVNENETSINIKTDLYSGWKEWTQYETNSAFVPAIRATGGDAVGGGEFSGDIYFLINGWKLYIDVTKTKVDGVLYSDDFDTPYYNFAGTAVYPITVSNLVRVVQTQSALDVDAIATAVAAKFAEPSITTAGIVTAVNSDINTELDIINEGVKKASLFIPHNTDI